MLDLSNTQTSYRLGRLFAVLERAQEIANPGINATIRDRYYGAASSTPVAVTRHGQTVGYFIPTQGEVEANVAALKKASKTLDQMLAAQDVDVETVVADFKSARKSASAGKKPKSQAA